jgi:hypothetical protein
MRTSIQKAHFVTSNEIKHYKGVFLAGSRKPGVQNGCTGEASCGVTARGNL